MGIYIKDTILKIFGYFILIFGGFVFLLGLAMWIEGDPQYLESGRGITIVSPAFWLPGLIMVLRANQLSKEEKLIEFIVQLVKTHRKISLDVLASKTGLTQYKIEHLLAKALNAKIISGFIDRTTQEFSIENTKKIQLKYCTSCGASINKEFLEGDTVKCPNCGNIY